MMVIRIEPEELNAEEREMAIQLNYKQVSDLLIDTWIAQGKSVLSPDFHGAAAALHIVGPELTKIAFEGV